jgi:hypothetical protein
MMNTAELIYLEAKTLPEPLCAEVLDFIGYLRSRRPAVSAPGDKAARLAELDGVVRQILVFFGGADPSNETAKALRAIQRLDRPEIAVVVVVGAANPHRAEIEALCAELPNASFHCQVANMAELMARADILDHEKPT